MQKHSRGGLLSWLKGLWHTDCAVCQRLRLYGIWALFMLVVYFYVWD